MLGSSAKAGPGAISIDIRTHNPWHAEWQPPGDLPEPGGPPELPGEPVPEGEPPEPEPVPGPPPEPQPTEPQEIPD